MQVLFVPLRGVQQIMFIKSLCQTTTHLTLQLLRQEVPPGGTHFPIEKHRQIAVWRPRVRHQEEL